jgi:isopenicillin N synthase-like dioxygenase
VTDEILDVDLLAFERGDAVARRAVVDGVRRSLATGFVYTSHDLGEGFLDDVYGALAAFFALATDAKQAFAAPGSNGQRGYTGPLIETAAAAEVPDWKEMLNWGRGVPVGHPLRTRYPHRYLDAVLPETAVAGSEALLLRFHDRLADVQRRFLRVIACAIGCHESYFDEMLVDGATLSRAIRYPPMAEAPDGSAHVWAGEHGDINLITALPRATTRGLQVRLDDGRWVDAVAPDGQAIINTGMMLERISNGVLPVGWHRVVAEPDQLDERLSVVQFAHPTPWTILAPVPSCVTESRPLRFATMEAGAELDRVLYEINLAEGARRVSDRPPRGADANA